MPLASAIRSPDSLRRKRSILFEFPKLDENRAAPQ